MLGRDLAGGSLFVDCSCPLGSARGLNRCSGCHARNCRQFVKAALVRISATQRGMHAGIARRCLLAGLKV